MVERTVSIVNPLGLHARPAAEFVKTASAYNSEVTVEKDGMVVNGKSIMGVMTLAAECGSSLTIRANGPDADRVVGALVTLVENGFSEE